MTGDAVAPDVTSSISRCRRPSSSALIQQALPPDVESPVLKTHSFVPRSLRCIPGACLPKLGAGVRSFCSLRHAVSALLVVCALAAAVSLQALLALHDRGELWPTLTNGGMRLRGADEDRLNGWSADTAAGPWMLGMVTDEDKQSAMRMSSAGKLRPSAISFANHWASWLKRGVLTRSGEALLLSWLDEVQLDSKKSRHGRGMELSCLTWFQGRLLTPDDRGFLYEIKAPRSGLAPLYSALSPSGVEVPYLKPRGNLFDADKKPMKAEWSLVKDGRLIIGSHGREMTAPGNGSQVTSRAPMLVQVLDRDGVLAGSRDDVQHLVNWTANYNTLRAAVQVEFPGYLMHEAVLWSHLRRRFYFLPRRLSAAPYDSADVEFRGGQLILEVDEHFIRVRTILIKGLPAGDGARGFSAAAFVPGSGEQWIVSLRTVEHEHGENRKTSTFLSVFDISRPDAAHLLLPEHNISNRKFEGLAFL
jgi:soluble calcium-activated nucleotidase 1